MTLADFEILPGIVISTDDPLNMGRVKACAPGLFNTTEMTVEDMMWIYPFSMSGLQSFSKMNIGSKIWIMHNINNYFEYWYIPKFELNSNSPEIANMDGDIIMARTINGQNVQVFFSKDKGFNIIAGNSKLNIDTADNISISNENVGIYADAETIRLGNNNNIGYSATKAEELIKCISNFCANLSTVAMTAINNPFTASLANGILNSSLQLQRDIESIKSENVKIS